MRELIFLAIYSISSYYDARYRHVPDRIWLLSLPAIIPYLHISISHLIAIGIISLLFYLNILGGADFKITLLSIIYCCNPLEYILRVVLVLCVSAQVHLIYHLIKKTKPRMEYPFIPLEAIIFSLM